MAEAAQNGFVHLRVRSAYSLLEGAIKADAIGLDAEDYETDRVHIKSRMARLRVYLWIASGIATG
mgnify:CR=1 FL=1